MADTGLQILTDRQYFYVMLRRSRSTAEFLRQFLQTGINPDLVGCAEITLKVLEALASVYNPHRRHCLYSRGTVSRL